MAFDEQRKRAPRAARLSATMAVGLAFACGGSTASSPDPIDSGAGGTTGDDGGRDASGDGTEDIGREDIGPKDMQAMWQKLAVENGYGPCPTASCSSSWVVTPDGHIEKLRSGDAGVAQMSSPDLAELDSIVTSAAFIDGMAKGFVCNQPPTDVFVSLRLERNGVSQMQGVTGCVFSGPSGNLPRRVNELVSKY